jgi:hypothetical protein
LKSYFIGPAHDLPVEIGWVAVAGGPQAGCNRET